MEVDWTQFRSHLAAEVKTLTSVPLSTPPHLDDVVASVTDLLQKYSQRSGTLEAGLPVLKGLMDPTNPNVEDRNEASGASMAETRIIVLQGRVSSAETATTQ